LHRSLGWTAIDWIERWVPHGPGDMQGRPLKLDDEECLLLLEMYAVGRDGRRCYDETLYSRPKGRRKTELAGACICFEALGPCRFDRWGRGRGPVGRRVVFPFIRVLATEEGQASETSYNAARFQLEQIAVSHSGEFSGLDVGLTRTFLPGGGEIRPCAAKGASKDGGKESFVVAEETHLYTTPELRSMYATVKRNLTKRPTAEPHLLQCSTMFGPGQGSVAESTHQAAGSDVVRLLLDHRQGPDVELVDGSALRSALAAAYGPAWAWVDRDRIVAHITDPRTDQADAYRYYLNRPVAVAGGWLPAGAWESRTDATVVVPDGERVCLGFDGARFEDSTALIAVTVTGGHVFPVAVWERPAAGDGWEVPADEVDLAVEQAMDRWQVLRLYADPPWWESQVDVWAGRWPAVARRWWTNREHATAFAVRACETAVRSGELTHNGDARLAAHVGNARRRPTRVRDDDRRPMHVIAKEHRHSARKVDAAVAMVLAWEARRDAVAAGALREPVRSGYRAAGF
jgi:hypothetical protein